ncbi:MAG TPA: 30S ribosome-binding factor RbfA [Burkholderiales bacterium]|nr:30S ribosome-binding factor RbfA [Burkholderiales bacterium]
MKKKSGRPQKLGDLIQREVSDLIRLEVRDPRVGMITITSVDVSPDMTHAKIFFTVLEKDKLQDTLAGLKRSAGFLRAQLAKRVQMYTTPELRFVYDESVERGDRLSRLIDEALRPAPAAPRRSKK